MTRWLVCLASALAVHGCGASDFQCQSDSQCSGGTCLVDGYCGFPDDECPSGLRYGELSGPLAGQCVPAAEATDGSTSEASTGTVSTSTMSSTGPDPATSTTEAGSTDPVVTSEPTTMGTGSSTGEPLDPSLVLWLDFEGPPDDWLSDRSAFANHGVCAPKACPEQAEGVFGSAARFTGSSTVVVAHNDSLATPSAFTLSVWHRLDEAPDVHRAILTKAIGGVFNSWELYYYPNVCPDCPTVGMAITDGDATVRAPTSSRIGAWIHLAATWDGMQLSLWVDGALIMAENVGALMMVDEPVVVGGDDDDLPSGYDGLFIGAIDEVRIYDRALDPDEIVALAAPP